MSIAPLLRLADYLGHILEAIERCRNYVADMDEAAFMKDQKTQDAVMRTLEIIGEASNNVRKRYPEVVNAHPEIPFAKAVGMRNVLSHGYFQVDLEAVWKLIHADLPTFQEAVGSLLASLPDALNKA